MSSLLEWLWKLLGWLVQYIPGWPSWWERRKLRGVYQQAIQGAHPVDPQVRQACLELLKKTDFFARFAYPLGVPVDHEFQEFLRRLQDRLPTDHAGIREELLSIYDELATLMLAIQSLAERGREVRDFLRRERGSTPAGDRYAAQAAEDFDWRQRVEQECTRDWPASETGCTLSEALALFCQVACLPTGDPDLDGFANKLRQSVRGYLFNDRAGERPIFFRNITDLLEPCLKRTLLMADPERYDHLHRPPPDWPGAHYNPTLADFYREQGFAFDHAPERIAQAARAAKWLRNQLAHEAPDLTERDMANGFVDFWLTMLWATAKYRRELESALFLLPWRAYLEKLVERWREHVRRWILLEGQELPSDDDLGLAELTAGELPIEGSENDTEGGADTENETGDEWEDSDTKDETEYEQDEFEEGESGEPEDEYAPLPELRRGKVHDLFEQVGRLILIADAGYGKTTSLQHYAYLQARSLLNNPRQFRPVPIYVELRYYRDHPEGGLWHLLRKTLGSNGSQVDGGFEQFRREIAEGKGILLLDGLNEVQDDLQEQALRELEELIGESPQARLVITSRPGVPLHRLRLPVFELHFLTDEQRVEFLRRHFPNERAGDRFIRTLRRNSRLWKWGRNPLQLWMLAQVGLKAKGDLPENRGQLLRQFVEYLLKREESKGPQTPRDIKLDLLSELGYQTRQAGRVSFSRLQAWQIIGQRCQQMHYQVDSAEFVREVCDNHLLADQGEQLAFAHEMYQEYFAACGLKRRYEADPQAIESLRGQPHWREPLVLLYGLLQNPDNLFQWLVSHEPAVAAECLLSSVEKQPTQLEHLRKRLREVDYARASDEELGKVLEAIYVLGDGELLAEHLCQRQRHRRFKDVAQQIAEVFSGEKSALRATLEALKQLGNSAWFYHRPLLQPLRRKGLKIPGKLQQEAARLWRTWRNEYRFPEVDLLLLASAFQIQRHLADEIRQLVEKWLQHGQFKLAQQWIRAFGLPLETVREAAAAKVKELLEQGQWEPALKAIEAFGLPLAQFQEAAAAKVYEFLQQGQWDAARQGIEAFGLPAHRFREAAAAKVQELLQQGRWNMALQIIQALDLSLEEFQEAAIQNVQDLLHQGQWKAALRGIQEFGPQREAFAEAAAAVVRRFLEQGQWEAAVTAARHFYDYFADRIHAGGEKRKRCLDWMTSPGQSQTRLRNGVATVLLRRYGDVENALAVVGSLGFTREHIEHNRALIERVEKINQALAQTGALPEREDMRDLELFGYVHESGWILTPGFRDFRISESAKQHGLAGRVVRFWLVVERHPADNRPVLNATNLVPV